MPSKNKQIHTQTFDGGMVTSIAPELRPSNTYEYMLNCVILSSGEGNQGIVVNSKGNTLITTPLPEGDNETIGYATDEEANKFYFAVWNSNDYHTWYQFDAISRTVSIVLQNLTDTDDIDILRFDRDYSIYHADVVQNNLLYWVDGLNNARKFNIDKAKDKSITGYGLVVREDYINAYKKTSVYAPKAIYKSDTTKQFNRLYGRLFKFIVRPIFDDGEKGNWSEISNVPLPLGESISGVSSIPSNNNYIEVEIETGSPIVISLEIGMLCTDPDGALLNFVSIANLNKEALGISSDSNYTYSFYNDGNYPATSPEKVIRPYSFIFKKPRCQSIVKNALTYWNGYEGFDDVPLNTEVSIDYDPLFIEDGTLNEFNNATFARTSHEVAAILRDFGGVKYRETYETVAIGSDVKKGNIFRLDYTTNGSMYNLFIYEATQYDTSITVANRFRNYLASRVGDFVEVSAVTTDGSQTSSFSYTYRGGDYIDGYPSVTDVQFNSLKDTGESKNNIKLGSSSKYGYSYEDEDGRKSLVYTNDDLVVDISPINEFEEFRKPVITIQVKHQPPVWAKYYQIVRSPDLIYNNYIQLITQQALDVEASDAGTYLDLIVGSLFTYQQIHENTVLQYTFKKGDRIRFISWIDSGTLVKTYYDFYETEILSYKEEVEEIKKESISTTAASATLTIDGATSVDNIGKILLVDGAERTITDAPSGTTYTVNSNMAETKTFLTYSIIDRRGTIRISKPPTDIIAEVKDNSIVEIYEPASNTSSSEVKSFYEFGIKYPILNYGTATRSHAGFSQNQDGTSAATLISTPAIIKFDNGTAYVRNRELPITNVVPGAQVLIDTIEDAGYSDYYVSNFNNNGRITAQDTGDGEVHFGSRGRFSNNYIENTRINGLNDFDNLDREDYNDSYGDIKRTLFKDNRIYAFKTLRDTWVPIRQNILSQADGTPLVGLSSKLLNDMQYFEYDGGVGDSPDIAVNSNWIYHVMPTVGVIVRLGGSGVIPISEVYFLDNKVKEYLREAKKYGAKIGLEFERQTGNLIVTIGQYKKYIYNSNFDQSRWTLFNEVTEDVYEIVVDVTHGNIVFTSPTQWTYTPDTDYVGSDFFTYRAFIEGVWSDPEQVCLTITANPLTTTAWRVKSSSSFCVLDGIDNTGYKGWTLLEQYILGLNTLTGLEKDNIDTDADYVSPVFDDVTCEIPVPLGDFQFFNSTPLTPNCSIEGTVLEFDGVVPIGFSSTPQSGIGTYTVIFSGVDLTGYTISIEYEGGETDTPDSIVGTTYTFLNVSSFDPTSSLLISIS